MQQNNEQKQNNEQQHVRVDEKEIALIKRHFADNEPLLKAIRAVFFGLETTKEERKQVKDLFASDEVYHMLEKRLSPQLEKDAPIGQVADVWMGVEEMVYGASKSTVYQAVQYKKKAIDMTKQGLAFLKDPDSGTMDVSYNPDANPVDEYQTDLLARNMYIRHIESQLTFLRLIAGSKEETLEEAQKRLYKNSSV